MKFTDEKAAGIENQLFRKMEEKMAVCHCSLTGTDEVEYCQIVPDDENVPGRY